MPESLLLSHREDAVLTLTINRPDKLNALDAATLDALDAAFAEAATDDGVRVVILTGAGPKAFVAGADIAEMNALTPVQGRDFSLRGQRMMRRIECMPKPVIAMVNGFALGGGLELAMACHLRIAADNAKVGQPEVNLGLVPGFAGTQRLLRLAGRAAAMELCLLGTPIDADRALALGIVNRVVPAADLEAETRALAGQLARAAPLALRGIIDCLNVGGECGIEEGMAYESAQFGLVFASDDMREGHRRVPGAAQAGLPGHVSGPACPVCGCASPGSTAAHAISAAIARDDIDLALALGLMDAHGCTACAPACREATDRARASRQRAFDARDRYRERAARLQRLEGEREARRAPTTTTGAAGPIEQAPPALPDAAAAALARAKARAAQRKPR